MNRIATSSKHVLWALLFGVFAIIGTIAQKPSESEVDRTVELIGKEYKFIPDQFSVKTGNKVKIIFKNEGTISHDFHIKELDFKTEPIQPGKSVTYTFTAPDEPTEYRYECKVAGHGPAGMKGKITVKSEGGSSETNQSDKESKKSGEEPSSGNKRDSGTSREKQERSSTVEKTFRKRMSKRRSVEPREGWGVVEGHVLLKGEKPEPYTNDGARVFEKQCDLKGAFEVQYVDVNEKMNGLKDTLVYVESLDQKHRKLLPPQETTIVQKHCRFHPSVQVVREKGKIKLMNADPAVHNFKYTPSNPLNTSKGDLTQKQKKDGLRIDRITIDNSDVYTTKCNVHPWMNGMVLAVDHHGYDVTGSEGQFRIQLPPGKYTLHVRHYTQNSPKKVEVSVQDGTVTRRNIKLSLK